MSTLKQDFPIDVKLGCYNNARVWLYAITCFVPSGCQQGSPALKWTFYNRQLNSYEHQKFIPCLVVIIRSCFHVPASSIARNSMSTSSKILLVERPTFTVAEVFKNRFEDILDPLDKEQLRTFFIKFIVIGTYTKRKLIQNWRRLQSALPVYTTSFWSKNARCRPRVHYTGTISQQICLLV